jgi:regulator of protease activity HflC (stomatin/prohibitin superfamily)
VAPTGGHHNDDRELELMRRITFLIPALVLAIAVLLSSIFVVDEREKALVLQFGQIRQVIEEPGLNFKIPFIQEVVYTTTGSCRSTPPRSRSRLRTTGVSWSTPSRATAS